MQRQLSHSMLQIYRRLPAAGAAQSAESWRRFCIGTDTSKDTHDDFKPKYKEEPVSDVEATIKSDISSHNVFIYMKGSPAAPQCGFSSTACRVLDAYGITFGSRNVLADPAIREGVKAFTSWPTIPQVFVQGEFIGGSDILLGMHENGELEKLADSLKGAK